MAKATTAVEANKNKLKIRKTEREREKKAITRIVFTLTNMTC
jgi:hypothetical protein